MCVCALSVRVGLAIALLFAFLVALPPHDVWAAEPVIPDYVHRGTVEHGLPQNLVARLLASRDGSIWNGATDDGIVRFDRLAFTVFDLTNTPGHGFGLAALKDGRLRTYARDANAPTYVSALLPEPNGELLIATLPGELVRFVNGRVVPITPPLPLGQTAIQALYRDDRLRSQPIGLGRDRAWHHSLSELPGTTSDKPDRLAVPSAVSAATCLFD